MAIKELSLKGSMNRSVQAIMPLDEDKEAFGKKLNNYLTLLYDNQRESEEYQKNLLKSFLEKLLPHNFINTSNRIDLAIYNGKDSNSTLGVIFEHKSLTNKSEMMAKDKINSKAFQEIVAYYLRERLFEHNIDNTAGLGRIGRLETPLNIKDFIKYLKDNLSLNTVSAVIGNEKDISVVALLGGSGADFIYTLPEEVDVYLTGDVGYHAALDAIEMKRNIIDIGHFAESLVKDLLLNYIAKLEVIVEKSNVEESPFKIL